MKTSLYKMYNEDRKKNYLKFLNDNYDSESHIQFVKNIFLNSYCPEVLYNTDVALFSYEQLKFLFYLNKWDKIYQFAAIKSHLIAYQKWCENNDFPTNPSIYNFKRDDILKSLIKENYPFKSISEIKKFFYDLFNMNNDNYYSSNLMKYCIIVLMCYGCSITEVMDIKDKDIDEKNRTITIGERKIKLDDNDFSLVKECQNATSMLVLHMGEKWISFDYNKTDYLIKQKGRNDSTDNRNHLNYGSSIKKMIENLSENNPYSKYNFTFIHLYYNVVFINGDKDRIPRKYKEEYSIWLKSNGLQ